MHHAGVLRQVLAGLDLAGSTDPRAVTGRRILQRAVEALRG
jgi:hypothetical protein